MNSPVLPGCTCGSHSPVLMSATHLLKIVLGMQLQAVPCEWGKGEME